MPGVAQTVGLATSERKLGSVLRQGGGEVSIPSEEVGKRVVCVRVIGQPQKATGVGLRESLEKPSTGRPAIQLKVKTILNRIQRLADLIGELGDHARAATPVEAAHAGDLVVATVPLNLYKQLPADALAGKIVVDTWPIS